MEKRQKGHKIYSVLPGSIGEELEIAPGDFLLSINGQEMEDVFDYHYALNEDYLVVLIRKANGEEWELEIEKEYEEDLGLEFGEGLMDTCKSCTNRCVFCFIDQMPPGMRDTLYFKDDDARLSFLQGNYITLTNMKDKDLERIIYYKLAPVNISVHTMNPKLREQMLHNRFAGEALAKLDRLYEAGITMNSQAVLCKGWNDGEELDDTIRELAKRYPVMNSLSVVPVGLTKYRDHLEELTVFQKEEAKAVLEQIHGWQRRFLKELGTRFVFASDEWYLLAEHPMPKGEAYEGYGQIENGVGMVRSLWDEVCAYVKELRESGRLSCFRQNRTFSMATGMLAAPLLEHIVSCVKQELPNMEAYVYPIVNDFFGHNITVAGLLTGQDLIAQLAGRDLGEYLLLPNVLLRNGEQVLLDDVTVSELSEALQIEIRIVQSDGKSLIDAMLEEEWNE